MDTSVQANRSGADPAWLGGLPRKDLYVIPLIAVVTFLLMLAIAVGCELLARRHMPALSGFACLAEDEADGISHGLPGCTGEGQAAGAPRVEYSFNECGYRNLAAGCGPLPAGVRRIAIIGASFAEGWPVAVQNSFAGILEPTLSKLCDKPVEVENLGAVGNDIAGAYREMDETQRLKASVVILSILPTDLYTPNLHQHVLARNESIAPQRQKAAGNLIRQLIDSGALTPRLVKVIRDFSYRDTDYYVKTYLRMSDKSDYLRVPFTPMWEQRLADLDLLLGEMTDRLRHSGAQLALLFAPARAQAAILGHPARFPGTDAHALSRRLQQITDRHGVLLIDATSNFATHSDPEQLYFAVDGHPNESGQSVIAGSIVTSLTTAPGSPFLDCAGTGTARAPQ